VEVSATAEGYRDFIQRFTTNSATFQGGFLRSSAVADDIYELPDSDEPYELTRTTEIPPGVTLRVPGGTQFAVSDNSLRVFWVQGTLDINGTFLNRVSLDGSFEDLFYLENPGVAEVSISWFEAQASGNRESIFPATGNAQSARIGVTDSSFSGFPTYSYIWYPEEVVLERNIFRDSGGFSFGLSDAVFLAQHNLFVGRPEPWYDEEIWWFQVWAHYGESSVAISENEFSAITGGAITVDIGSGNSVDLSNNYWPGLTLSDVEQLIFDENDGLDWSGTVQFEPLAERSHENVPNS
jgi:hypothetical protein